MYCPECGHHNRDQARFCGRCGAALIEPTEAETTMSFTPPPEAGPEVAFAGRSNVGKSSAINALAGRIGADRRQHLLNTGRILYRAAVDPFGRRHRLCGLQPLCGRIDQFDERVGIVTARLGRRRHHRDRSQCTEQDSAPSDAMENGHGSHLRKGQLS